ncbi:phage tail protein [Pseudomonas parafulva]|uniref:phage tail protein n=1 Tax=Pseudomonas parafulva TaxID=157782 RepID=UPI0035644E90
MMKIYYHHDTRSFLDSAAYSQDQIPADAIEIDVELKKALLEGERQGQLIIQGEGGMPELATAAPDPDASSRRERYWRDGEIQRVTWLRERHRDEVDQGHPTTLTSAQFSELLAYIQQLRDWPQGTVFPATEHRPNTPAWIADQI